MKKVTSEAAVDSIPLADLQKMYEFTHDFVNEYKKKQGLKVEQAIHLGMAGFGKAFQNKFYSGRETREYVKILKWFEERGLIKTRPSKGGYCMRMLRDADYKLVTTDQKQKNGVKIVAHEAPAKAVTVVTPTFYTNLTVERVKHPKTGEIGLLSFIPYIMEKMHELPTVEERNGREVKSGNRINVCDATGISPGQRTDVIWLLRYFKFTEKIQNGVFSVTSLPEVRQTLTSKMIVQGLKALQEYSQEKGKRKSRKAKIISSEQISKDDSEFIWEELALEATAELEKAQEEIDSLKSNIQELKAQKEALQKELNERPDAATELRKRLNALKRR